MYLRTDNHTGNSMSYFLWIVAHKYLLLALRGCQTGSMVYHHYLRRLERLTICRFNYNCSTFSSCQGSNPGPLARQSDAQPTEPISRKLCLEDDRILAKSKQLVDVDTLVNLHFFIVFGTFSWKMEKRKNCQSSSRLALMYRALTMKSQGSRS